MEGGSDPGDEKDRVIIVGKPPIGGLPARKQQLNAIRYNFKHAIKSLQGYNPDHAKSNQDFAEVHTFTSHKEVTKLFMLADGHGSYGQEASALACKVVSQQIDKKMSEANDNDLTDEEIKKIMTNAFSEAHTWMEEDFEDRFRYSGTTLLVFLVRKNTIFLASVGDSKAILASKIGNHIVPTMVSRDHKPDIDSERERIEKAGGIVTPYLDSDHNPSGPARVWNKERTQPGLATSRTLGDIVGHRYGVSHIPGSFILTKT